MFKAPNYKEQKYQLFKPPPAPPPLVERMAMKLLKQFSPGCATCAALKNKS
jgi:hypothetical protein